MEFKGIGVLSFDTPSEDMKSFYRRKYETFFKSFKSADPKLLTEDDMKKYVAKGTKYIMDPTEKEETTKRYLDIHVTALLDKGKAITEERFVDQWMSRAFGDRTVRKEFMEWLMKGMKDLFQCVDYNKDDYIDLEEFSEFYNIYDFNTSTTARTVFDVLDVNKDGYISAEEFAYGKLSFLMCCGPDDPIKLFYGPLVAE